MRKSLILHILLAASIAVGLAASGCSSGSPPARVPVTLTIHVEDATGAPVNGAGVTVIVNLGGQPVNANATGTPGEYEADFDMNPAGGQVTINVVAPAGSGLADRTVQVQIADPQNPPEPTIVLAPEHPPAPNI